MNDSLFLNKIFNNKNFKKTLNKIVYKQLYRKFETKVKYFIYKDDIILFISEKDVFDKIYKYTSKYINLDALKVYYLDEYEKQTKTLKISKDIIIISENGNITITKKTGGLDYYIIKQFTVENFIKEYEEYKEKKTDPYIHKVNIKEGSDGISYEMFEKNIKHISESACKRIRKEKYFFSSFIEVDVPKPPYVNSQIKEAREQGAIRVLSMATIKDIITQKLIYKSILEYCENKFSSLKEDPSYGYRINRSAPMAVKQIYIQIKRHKKIYVLDADIKKFFDEIPHNKLLKNCEVFFGSENKLLLILLKRFISVNKVKNTFLNKKTKKSKNIHKIRKGIPQGGVLSGLLANIYMHEFDKFVVYELYDKYNNNIKYFRYADDFLILSSNKDILKNVYQDIKLYMNRLELTIHELGPIDSKTKIVDLTKSTGVKVEKVNFLGFEISQNYIGIKEDNINKFKNKFVDSLSEYINKLENNGFYPVLHKKAYDPMSSLEKILRMIRYKVYGNLAFEMNNCKGKFSEKDLLICKNCNGKINYRGWLTYFSIITDVEQLKKLDIWIRSQIYKEFYRSTKKFTNGKPIRLKKAMLQKLNTPSLEQFYYKLKRINIEYREICTCGKEQEYYENESEEYIDKYVFLDIVRDEYCKLSGLYLSK